uniref:Putative tail protein n=1 Tax=viral metagenome TaxID=1070528 RepID=A0A6M3LEC0_9ZZZZ
MKTTSLKLETQEFNKALKKFMAKSDVDSGKVIKKIAFDLLGNIIGDLPTEKTFDLDTRALAEARGHPISGRHPVDTGRARAGWYASIKGLGGNFDFTKPGPENNINSNKVALGQKEGDFIDNTKALSMKYVDLINGVDYILYLEYGYSMQAPAGMVRIGMRSMYGVLPKVMGKQFLADWNQLGM